MQGPPGAECLHRRDHQCLWDLSVPFLGHLTLQAPFPASWPHLAQLWWALLLRGLYLGEPWEPGCLYLISKGRTFWQSRKLGISTPKRSGSRQRTTIRVEPPRTLGGTTPAWQSCGRQGSCFSMSRRQDSPKPLCAWKVGPVLQWVRALS